MIVAIRRCRMCGIEKPLEEFGRVKTCRYGIRHRCKACCKKARQKWRKANPGKIKLYNRLHHQKYPQEAYLRVCDWREAHPKLQRESQRKRRERKHEAEGDFTEQEWLNLCAFNGNRCLCCHRSDLPLTVDHIKPLVMGGTNYISNIQPLCKSCNSKKHTSIKDYR